MIDAMDGGMFFYLYRVADPTSVLTTAARLIEDFGFDLLLHQPANRILVPDYTLTAVTDHSGSVNVECTVRDYVDDSSVITTVPIRMPSVRYGGPDLFTFGVDGILPNASHQVVAVPPAATDRWVTVRLEVGSGCLVFLSAVTVHEA
jgi:hypothetical protein